ncbi:MAG: UDP-N-acetylglucosamine--LPS N-acetylglucosamine transferase [Acidobacteriia bacterium]|nr:UDP-N-acetylglucosamine--LPS N-acetylglucosamine transferase [Terriglobia bacterium]
MAHEVRILVLSASVGAGHVRAAEAVEAALRRTGTPVTVENLDVLTLMAPAFRKLYRDGYFEMVRRAPRIVGWLYDATDKPFHKDLVRQKLEQAGAARLLKKIREYDPDVAICTHFLPTALLDRERRKGRCRARIVTVVTDFEVHGMWLATPSDHYFVANGEARAHLEAMRIASSAITVSGIPTHPVFAEKKDRLDMRRKHGWREDLPAILVSAGGFGAGNAGRMLEALIAAEVRAQIIAVCGKSMALKTSIDRIVARRKGNTLPVVKTVGFTTQMDEFMAAADLMIGKPGGLTTSESLIKGLGWVVVNPIPGQEEKNAIYLLEQGVGVWCDNLYTLAFKVRSVLEEPGRLEAMRKNALRLARTHAADVVARFVTGGRS